MKRPEPSPETLRSSAQLRDRKPDEPPTRHPDDASRTEGDYRPQYLDLPPRRSGGVRNVLVGVFLIFTAALVLAYATYLMGPRALLPLGIALLTAVVLFAVARLRILRQRNGGFVALGLVCLLGVVFPLVEYAFSKDAAVRPTPDETASSEPATSLTTTSVPAAEPQSLKEAFNLQPPADDAFAFKVLQDLRVDINGKKYVIKAGDQFVVSEMTGEDVRFTAGGEQIALPLNMVEMLGSPEPATTAAAAPGASGATAGQTPPASDNPASVASTPQKKGPVNITEEAQREAIRRFPALGVPNSRENQLFVDSYQELKLSGQTAFFSNPEWPLALADILAKRHGWKPGQTASESAMSDGADEISGLPEEEAPRPKRRPVAEELDDEPEPEPGAEAPAAADETPETMEAPSREPENGSDLPAQ